MNKALLVFITLLVLLGGTGALAFLGIINIPGITPAKSKSHQKSTVATKTAAPDPKVLTKKPTPPPLPDPPRASKKPDQVMDKDQGAKKLAKLWNGVESNKLIDVLKDWKDPDVARVFTQMDPDKVAEVLGLMDAKRASKISLALEKEASVVKVDS